MQTKIYILSDEMGKLRYVGKTLASLSARFRQHLHCARRGDKSHLYNWMRLVLSRGFVPGMTLIGTGEGDGGIEERAWIKYFRDEGIDLCNTTDGGDGVVGWKHSLEARAKMSASKMGTKCGFRIGHTVSPEHRAKLAERNRGNKYCLGFKHSQEARKHMSEAHVGHPAWNKGKLFSEEARVNMSKAKRGKPWTEARRKAQQL